MCISAATPHMVNRRSAGTGEEERMHGRLHTVVVLTAVCLWTAPLEAAVSQRPADKRPVTELLDDWQRSDRAARLVLRSALAEALVERGSEFLPILSGDSRQDLSLVFRLIEDGRRAEFAPSLLELLSTSQSPEVRTRAAVVLGRIGANGAARPVCSLLHSESSADVRAALT